MAAYGVSGTDVSNALAANDFISAVGRTQGQMVTVDLTADTGLHSVDEFRNLVIKSQNGAHRPAGRCRQRDARRRGLRHGGRLRRRERRVHRHQGGAHRQPADGDRRRAQGFSRRSHEQLPEGFDGRIVYDATKYVNSSIREVIWTLVEALLIVTAVIFLFLGSVRSVIIPTIAMPLSLIGAFFIMLVLGYTINLLTLLALVLAIGLVVDDAIIVVENVHRHMEAGMQPLPAAIQGARELAGPIIAISVVLIAVYVPIGFMGGLTGALVHRVRLYSCRSRGRVGDHRAHAVAHDVLTLP